MNGQRTTVAGAMPYADHQPITDRLAEAGDPEQLFRSIAGTGLKLAEQTHHDLDIDSLNDLEMTCRDGRLALDRWPLRIPPKIVPPTTVRTP